MAIPLELIGKVPLATTSFRWVALLEEHLRMPAAIPWL